MAIPTVKSNPTRGFSDLDLNFNANPITGDVTKNTGDLAVINAIRYLLQTNHYETPFNPSIGGNITKLLFENADELTAQALQKEIRNTITNYETRVQIQSLTVTGDPNNNLFQVNLTIFILNNINPTTINLFLKRIT